MKNQLLKTILLLLTFTFVIASCKKHIEGPRGEQGTAGHGIDPNQYYTISLTQADTAWKAKGNVWESVLWVPEITADIIRQGEVIVYLQKDSAWHCLPHQVGDLFTQYSIVEGRINLKLLATHSSSTIDKPGTIVFRVVVVSSGIL